VGKNPSQKINLCDNRTHMSAQGSSGSAFYARRIMRGAPWVLFVLFVTYGAIVLYAYPHDHEQHLAEATVTKIEAQKLTMVDVDGSHLPPPPDSNRVDETVAGIDANGNGIRDDVELAIFAEYSTSTETRSAELQYAMDLQIQLTEVFDPTTWEAAAKQNDRGFGCLYDTSESGYGILEKEVEGLVLNTPDRIKRFKSIEQYRVSYKLSSGPDCDVVRD
jgi:hypothetical protein